ncbi:MAG TPA: NAD(P)-dependent oxidoreductase [Micromonosporaceae bacterium]
MRVLITGAGLLGAHVAAELTTVGHSVAMLDVMPDDRYLRWLTGGSDVRVERGDARDPGVVATALRHHHAHAVVHTAALLGRKATANPYLAFQVNAGATAAVAEAARLTKVSRMVHVSSLAVYDWHSATADATVDESFPTAARTPYSASKLAGEAVVGCYAASGWLEVCVLRLAGVYGPGRHRGGAVFGGLLQQVMRRALGGEPVTVPARLDGHEYLYVADAARALRLVLERELTGVYNVGTGRTYSVAEVAEGLRSAIPGGSVNAAVDRSAPPGHLDVTRIRRALPEWSCTGLDAGFAALARALGQNPWLCHETNLMEGQR